MAQTMLPRPSGSRKTARKQKASRTTASSVVTLGSWQLRQTWRLLMVIGAGILIAVILICAIPLYVQVSLSAGLRQTLAQDPQNLYFTVYAQSLLFSSDELQDVQGRVSFTLQGRLGTTVAATPTVSVQIPALTVTGSTTMQLIGTDIKPAASHVKLLQGHLPRPTSGTTIEFVATAQGAKDLHLQSGKTFALPYPLIDPSSNRPIIALLHLQLVGIIAPTASSDAFWRGETFAPSAYNQRELLPVMVSNSELESVLDQLSTAENQQHPGAQFSVPPAIYWYYAFDFSHVDINHLADLTGSLKSTLTLISNNPESPPYIVGTTAFGPLSVLQSYADRVAVFQLPTSCLAYLIAGLILFFVLLMADLLVERQMEAIALLRSRGASMRQVFGSLLGQGVSLGLLAFVAGPLLAILLVIGLSDLTLTAVERVSLNLLTDNLLMVVQGQLMRDLLVVGVAVLGMALSIWRVLRGNILVLRRESARATHQPFWMRFRLDLLAAVVALAGFGLSLYVANPGVLDVHTRVLVLPLTSLVGVLFLLLGFLLLFLRVYPALLRLGERLAARNRGAAPLLALAQMARSPRQALRMALLLTLAVAFALFALIFNQTEGQRLTEIAAYQVGGDFSGAIPGVLSGDNFEQQLAFYRGIKGVTSVTLGAETLMEGGSDQNALIALNAVDSSSYASTIYWTAQDGDQPIERLTSRLQAGRTEAEKNDILPALIDDAAAQSLGVSVGQEFALADFHGPMNFVVVGIVHYLPTVFDTAGGTGSDTSVPNGGVLVDFETYSNVALAVNENGVSLTNVWMRSSSQPTALANVRNTLFTGTYALANGLDRRLLLQSLKTDPFYLTMIGILALGASVALLLGLLGNLLVSWWSARGRRTSFAILRALGCKPGQIIWMLLWEQGLIYGTTLALGILLSAVFSLSVLPAFIFSPVESISSAEGFYVAQGVPMVQIAFPVWPILGLLLGLIAICVLAVGLMLRVVIRPQVSQTLRLTED